MRAAMTTLTMATMTTCPWACGKAAGATHGTFFPSQEVLPFHGRRRQADRLQGPADAQKLYNRDRQDRPEPHYRHPRQLPAPAAARHPARALPGLAALH